MVKIWGKTWLRQAAPNPAKILLQLQENIDYVDFMNVEPANINDWPSWWRFTYHGWFWRWCRMLTTKMTTPSMSNTHQEMMGGIFVFFNHYLIGSPPIRLTLTALSIQDLSCDHQHFGNSWKRQFLSQGLEDNLWGNWVEFSGSTSGWDGNRRLQLLSKWY